MHLIHHQQSTQSIADYLAQLLKDRKQLAAFPNVFNHVERLLDEGKYKLQFYCTRSQWSLRNKWILSWRSASEIFLLLDLLVNSNLCRRLLVASCQTGSHIQSVSQTAILENVECRRRRRRKWKFDRLDFVLDIHLGQQESERHLLWIERRVSGGKGKDSIIVKRDSIKISSSSVHKFHTLMPSASPKGWVSECTHNPL